MNMAFPSSLFDGTYMLYRLSPLYSATSPSLFSEEALLVHSQRFRNILKGDVLRGVHVDSCYPSEVPTASALLRACQWTQFNWPVTPGSEGRSHSQAPSTFKGIQVDVQYEKNTYTALLLQKSDAAASPTMGQVYLPLLMTRMPTGFRECLLDYLTTTFDVRIESMRLSSQFMGNALEMYLENTLTGGTEHFESVKNGVQLVLGFGRPIAPALKSLSIDIRREDVLDFYKKGKTILENLPPKLWQAKGTEYRAGRYSDTTGPFMAAVHLYLTLQVAMDIEHKDVSLSRASCGGFVLLADGKVKIHNLPAQATAEDELVLHTAPDEALLGLLKLLLNKAATRGVGNN